MMDVFVLPSLSECLPLSVLEAMAMSIPPVVTNVGGNSEIIENQQTGYIVSPADPDALAEKIVLLLKDKNTAKIIGLRACESITKKFSLEEMIAKYESIYLSLL
jgi:glycosyltransferase involved in cell wall biosynthesis